MSDDYQYKSPVKIGDSVTIDRDVELRGVVTGLWFAGAGLSVQVSRFHNGAKVDDWIAGYRISGPVK